MIYIVTSGSYSDYSINAVYTKKELAEEYIKEHEKVYGSRNDYLIEEYDADVPMELFARQFYVSTILIEDGKLLRGQINDEYDNASYHTKDGFLFGDLNERTHSICTGATWDYDPINRKNPRIYTLRAFTVKSFVSYEHADKVAVETLQAYNRETTKIGRQAFISNLFRYKD